MTLEEELEEAKETLEREEYTLRWSGKTSPYNYITSAQYTVVRYWRKKVEELENKLKKPEMNKININKYKDTYYFIWDNKDETIDMVNEYLKIKKGNNWKAVRNWEEETNSNTGDVLCICETNGSMSSNSFYRVGEYVVDTRSSFWGYDEDEFNKGEWKDGIVDAL